MTPAKKLSAEQIQAVLLRCRQLAKKKRRHYHHGWVALFDRAWTHSA